MPTAAENTKRILVARLKEHGLNLDWHERQLAKQNGICAECGETEKKTLKSGEPKSLMVDYDQKVLLCSICHNRTRAATQRVKVAENKAEKAEQEKLAGVTSFKEFWELNRLRVSAADLEKMWQRHDAITLLADAMQDYVDHNGFEGTNTTPDDLAETILEVRQEVADHGTIIDAITLVNFWKPSEKPFYQQVLSLRYISKSHEATAVFAEYGVFQALPEIYVRAFQKMFDPDQLNRLNISFNPYVNTCLRCGESARVETFKDLVADWYCPKHQAERDAKARKVMSQFNDQRIATQKSNSPFDDFGRVKSSDKFTIFGGE